MQSDENNPDGYICTKQKVQGSKQMEHLLYKHPPARAYVRREYIVAVSYLIVSPCGTMTNKVTVKKTQLRLFVHSTGFSFRLVTGPRSADRSVSVSE